MKALKSILVTLVMTISISGLAAGGESGGGGSAHVCFSDLGTAARVRETRQVLDGDLSSIVSIELLDILEARARASQKGQHEFFRFSEFSLKGMESDIQRMAKRLGAASEGGHWLQLAWNNIRDKSETLAPLFNGKSSEKIQLTGALPWAGDTGQEPEIAPQCAIVTMLYHQVRADMMPGTSDPYLPMPPVFFGYIMSLDVDQRLFFHPRHSSQSRSFGILHEVVYVAMKKSDEKGRTGMRTSEAARLMVELATVRYANETSRSVYLDFKALVNFGNTPIDNVVHTEIISKVGAHMDSFVKSISKKSVKMTPKFWKNFEIEMAKILDQGLIVVERKCAELGVTSSDTQQILRWVKDTLPGAMLNYLKRSYPHGVVDSYVIMFLLEKEPVLPVSLIPSYQLPSWQ